MKRIIFLLMIIGATLQFGCEKPICGRKWNFDVFQFVYTDPDSLPQMNEEFADVLELMYKQIDMHLFDNDRFTYNMQFLISEKGVVIYASIKDRQKQRLSPFERQLISLVKENTSWMPAICNGKKVTSYFYFPIRIKPEE